MLLIGVLFTPSDNELAHDRTTGGEYLTVTNGLMPLNEEQIPYLVDKFLENVHTKNPVLDVEQLVKQSRVIASNGLGWDAWSCLVLLAAALGTVAKPFDASVTTTVTLDGRTDVTWTHDGPTTPKELQQAESYFALASRRLGSLRHSILGAQCYFFAGGKSSLMFRMSCLLIIVISISDVYNATTAELAILYAIIESLSALHEDLTWTSSRYLAAWSATNRACRYLR